MPDVWECPSPDCTWMIDELTDLAPHINENHLDGFRRDDWLTFSNPDSVQYQGQQRRRDLGTNDEDDEE